MSDWIGFSSNLDDHGLQFALVIFLLAVAAFAAAISFRKPCAKIAQSALAEGAPTAPRLPFCFSKRRVVIFDFDNVLTTHEVKEVSEGRVFTALKKVLLGGAFGGEERLALLDAFLDNLSQCADLGIVSRNSRQVIEASLSSADLKQYFHMIFGHEDYQDSVPKSKIIQHFLEQGVNKHDLLFVDDMFLECE